MKKMRVLVSVVLALTMCFALVACTTKEEEPTVTITSEAASITTNESYTLAFDATNAKKTEVIVSEKDGKTTGAYDNETKVFTATDAGEYTISVKVTNVAKTAEASVKVTVTLPLDTTAPVITYAQTPQEKYTMVSGASVKLPLATAIDSKDGDVDVNVEVTSKGATLSKGTDGYTFTSKTAGKYKISYSAIDSSENEVEQFLNVEVTPIIAETSITAAENKIDNLDTSDLTFKENFQDGYSGAFAKGLAFKSAEGGVKSSIEATDSSIAGNSLVLDYSTMANGAETAFYFNSIDSKIRSGRWTIAMDVKLLGGEVPGAGLFFSFVYEGDTTGDNKSLALGAVNETKSLNYSDIKTFDPAKKWYFRIFFNNSDEDYSYAGLKIAVDNISFTWKHAEDSTAIRTGESVAITADQLDGNGYTITGTDDNFTKLSGATTSVTSSAMYLTKSKLVTGDRLTAEQAANLTPANGFNSDYVILATSQVNTFNSLKNLATDPLYSYKLTYKVYSPNTNNWHIFFTNGSGTQAIGYQQAELTGVGTYTQTFVGKADYINLGLYNGGSTSLYIGDITLSRILKPIAGDTTPKGHKVGKTWTFDSNEDNFTPVGGGAKFVRVNSADVTLSGGEKLSAQAGFNARAFKTVLGRDVTNELISCGDYIEAECEYEITFVMYVDSITGTLKARMDDSFTDLATTTGLKTVTFTRTSTVDFMSFYTDASSSATVYLSSIKIKLTKIN